MPTTIDRTDALVERLFGATLGALELFSVYIGSELGLYQTLAAEPATAHQLAARAGIDERYAREWLEQQAVAGLLDVAADGERRYTLPGDHARVLASPDDAAHIAPFAHMLAGIGGVLGQVVDAYRTGGGVPYSDYGAAFRHGQGHINRPAFTHELPTAWIDAMPDIRGRLAGIGRHDLGALAAVVADPHRHAQRPAGVVGGERLGEAGAHGRAPQLQDGLVHEGRRGKGGHVVTGAEGWGLASNSSSAAPRACSCRKLSFDVFSSRRRTR